MTDNASTLIAFYDIEKTPIPISEGKYATTLYWFFVTNGTKIGNAYSNDIVQGGQIVTFHQDFDGYFRICSIDINDSSILTINEAIS